MLQEHLNLGGQSRLPPRLRRVAYGATPLSMTWTHRRPINLGSQPRPVKSARTSRHIGKAGARCHGHPAHSAAGLARRPDSRICSASSPGARDEHLRAYPQERLPIEPSLALVHYVKLRIMCVTYQDE